MVCFVLCHVLCSSKPLHWFLITTPGFPPSLVRHKGCGGQSFATCVLASINYCHGRIWDLVKSVCLK